MSFASKTAIVSLILYFLNGCFYERPFGYPAQIRQQGDVPCFAIENSRKTRRSLMGVMAISVYRYDSERAPQEGGPKEVWVHDYVHVGDEYPQVVSYFITPKQCILYNDDGKAPALEVGKKYLVDINTYVKQMESGERRLYYGYFCLSKDQSGNVAVHQVEWDDRKDGFNWDMCRS